MEEIKPSIKTFGNLCVIADEVFGRDNIKTIFEFGSRYGEDTVEFARRYPHATIYGFECNETTLPACRERVSKYPNIVLTEKAVTEKDGPINFYPINKEKTETTWVDGNQGASSLFKASGKYEIESYVQNEVVVEGISLKSFIIENKIDKVDIVWMDIQGAELMAMRGLDDRINSVGIIQAEVEFMEIYKKQPLFDDLKKYLHYHGFQFVGFNSASDVSADAVFIRNNLLNNNIIEICRNLLISPGRYDNIIRFVRRNLFHCVRKFKRMLRGAN